VLPVPHGVGATGDKHLISKDKNNGQGPMFQGQRRGHGFEEINKEAPIFKDTDKKSSFEKNN